MLPGVLKLFLQKVLSLLSVVAQMGSDDLLGNLSHLRFDNEEVTIGLALLGDSLSGVILDNVSSESVNWNSLLVVSLEVPRQLPLVAILPWDPLMIVSDKAMEAGVETCEVLGGLFDFTVLSMRVEFVIILSLFLSYIDNLESDSLSGSNQSKDCNLRNFHFEFNDN